MATYPKTIQTVGIITKRNICDNKKTAEGLVKFLKKHKKEIILDQNCSALFPGTEGFGKEQLLSKVDLAIVLGGDGTILKTARRLPRKKLLILGVNFGNLGFLTECHPDKMYENLEKVFENNFHADKRTLLRVTIYRGGKKLQTYLALNDAVINQGNFARLITMDLEVDNRKLVKVKSDGLILSTPTGSTAHSLSAGGPIVHPHIQGFTITPICPTSLSMRPIILPDRKQISITIETERREEVSELGLTLDGQDCMPLQFGDKITVRKSSRHAYFVRTGNRYYKMLRQKLHWGEL